MVGSPPRRSGTRRARIGFMPHFPAHDWYRAMIPAMQSRAAELRLEVVVTAPHHGISAEISRLRLEIARLAASTLSAGETIVLGEGEATLCLASEIRRISFSEGARLSGLTVITNSLDILHRLEGSPGIKTLLTSGEYQAADRCLVGPSLGALFDRVRADRAFLSVAGLSPRFGVSALDERLALAASRLGGAARRVVALADHTLVGAEANHRICRIEDVHLVITDDGTMAADRQSLRAAGIEVLVAGEDNDQTEPQTLVSPGWRTRERT
jgi:DeoR/GlpR family transcriptional regulator of sugar metabolism